ncbi:TatD family hydrolase [Sanguibacter sp. A247]|uniref:TatD family hydrolase n=1 Tax=unclassified Sanguibacter TaxID=2645534 RepID=UPI003FD83142
MGRRRERGWAPSPAPLEVPAVDGHTHLDSIHDVLGPDDPRPSIRETIDQAVAVGVTRMVQIGCDLPSAHLTTQLVEAHPELLGGVAIHPNEAPLHAGLREIGPDGLEPAVRDWHAVSLEDALAQIAELARHPRVRTVGETGLDFFRGGERAREVQRESFRAHLAIARETGLPVQIHDRDAHADVIDVLLSDTPPAAVVFHCFSGDAEMAKLCAEHGWFLSFAGPVTYNANEALRAALRVTPLSRLLVETDAPYLTPVPARGRPNAPYLLPHTVRFVADTLGLSEAEVATVTSQNAERLYGPW